MLKVGTPILYESALDELNRVRPLQLSDRIKLALDYPVLCSNPVGVGSPAIGKLARCDEQGALLKRSLNSSTNYEKIDAILSPANRRGCFVFSQKVNYVELQITQLLGGRYLYWCNSNYSVAYNYYNANGLYFIPFKGQVMYFLYNYIAGANCIFSLYGFYWQGV